MYAAISANGIAITFVARRSCRALRRSARMMISAIRYSCPVLLEKQPPQLRGRPKIVIQCGDRRDRRKGNEAVRDGLRLGPAASCRQARINMGRAEGDGVGY